ncbi:MAG: amidohydrolase family protein [Nitriliruptoraceae bacterium]|nr:amidohydrolase family protein [Nitriliruptoraceae bacterium]
MRRLAPAHLFAPPGPDQAPMLLSDHVVDVDEGRIVGVWSRTDAPRTTVAETALPGLLLPGFVDVHAHTPMVLLRGAGEGLPVDRWLTEVMWPRESRLTPDDIRVGMLAGGAQLLRGGITTSVEMYFAPDAMAEACHELGLRSLIAPPLLVSEELEAALGSWEAQLEAMVAFAAAHRDDALVDGIIGPHSAYTVPLEPLRAAAEAARSEGLLLHLHVAEGEHEGDGIRAEHGVSVPRYLADHGVLDAPVLAAHGVWLDDDDIALFAAHGTSVAHCPGSNGKHASGLAPVTALRAAGVPVAIATDGPASHDRLDLYAEMRLAIRFARLRERDAAALGASDALAMVTSEAARAIGRDDLGIIAPGARADLQHVAIDRLGPVVDPDDLLTHLVYSASPADVTDVWVEGRHVVAEGRVRTVDEVALAADVAARARRIASA